MNSLDAFSAFLVILIAIAIWIVMSHQFARRRHNAPEHTRERSEATPCSSNSGARRVDTSSAPSAKHRPVNLPASRRVHTQTKQMRRAA